MDQEWTRNVAGSIREYDVNVRLVAAGIAVCAALLDVAAMAAEARLVGDGVVSLGAVRRDGAWLSHVVEGNLAIRSLATGRDRILTKKSGEEFAYFSAMSRDGQWVAYAWFNAERFYELRLIAGDGSGERTIFRNEEAGFVQPCAFSADGTRVLTLFFRKDNTSQIAWVERETGKVTVLRSLEWVYPKKMDVSPDGKWIVYDSFAPGSRTERAIYLLAADGAEGRQLSRQAGSYQFPLWSPEGKDVYYWGGEGKQYGLWRQAVESGERSFVQAGSGMELPLGMTEDGEIFFGLRENSAEVYWLELAAGAKAKRATERFVGLNRSPAWSADGKSLAYLSRRGAANFGQESRVIVVRNLESGEERELQARLAHLESLQWVAQGLLVQGSDGKGRGGVFLVDAVNGATRPVDATHDTSFRGVAAALGPDGKLWKAEAGYAAVAVDPEGKRVARSGPGKGVVVEELESGKRRQICEEDFAELQWGAELWGAKGTVMRQLTPEPQRAKEIAGRTAGFSVSRDGKRLAFATERKMQQVWRLRVRP